jgi:hypothetical protein
MKLSKKELQDLNNLQQQGNEIIFALGELALQKEGLIEQYRFLSSQQNELGKSLSEKYGDGKIDLNTGEITISNEENQTPPSSS